MIKKIIILIFNLLLINNIYALQVKNAVDNETVMAKVSSTDVTRIFVLGDRIKSVKGLKGAYSRENDEKNGEVYLQPSLLYQDRAFTVLIATEQGRHFTLLLTPTASPSETLMLVPKGVGQERAAKFEQANYYELTLNHLMVAMKNGTLPEGYVMRAVDNKTAYQIGQRLRVTLKALYDGLNLRGEIYTITNNLTTSVQLDEREFYKKGTRAISVDTIILLPKSSINLYRIVSP
jgi:conjugal transfer pilus assembly protein TraK